MNPESKSPAPSKPRQTGCVEIIPSSETIEFIGRNQLCGFPTHHLQQLQQFILKEKSKSSPISNRPPDEISLFCPTMLIVFKGWRLKSLLHSLLCREVARIYVVDEVLAKLLVDEPVVSQIRIYPLKSESISSDPIVLNPPKTKP
ncbi:MAG TPA: hypothetical protein VIK53_02185 [Verrucomicrobiae bacterium]|jgi:hypothetical protein